MYVLPGTILSFMNGSVSSPSSITVNFDMKVNCSRFGLTITHSKLFVTNLEIIIIHYPTQILAYSNLVLIFGERLLSAETIV